MEEVEDVDVTDDGVGWEEFLRVKIRIDLTKPLSRGRVIKLNGKDLWVAFNTKKIPRFSFSCGVVMHDSRRFNDNAGRRNQQGEETLEYGSWLRVASPKRHYGHGGGWSNGQKQTFRQEGENSGETESNRSRRAYGRDDGGERRSEGGPVQGMAATRAQAVDRLFTSDAAIPNKERDDEERRDHGDCAINASETDGEREVITSRNQGVHKVRDISFMEKEQGDLERDNDIQNSNRKGASVYVGQWDALKEKIVWSTMGKEQVSPFTTCFMSGSTSPSLNDMEDFSASSMSPIRRNRGRKGGKNYASSQGQVRVRTKAANKGGGNHNTIAKVPTREESQGDKGIGKM